MSLFAHHMKGIIDIEVMGHDIGPDGPMEHAILFGVAAVVLVLVTYGAYAMVRDLLRWRRAKQGDKVTR